MMMMFIARGRLRSIAIVMKVDLEVETAHPCDLRVDANHARVVSNVVTKEFQRARVFLKALHAGRRVLLAAVDGNNVDFIAVAVVDQVVVALFLVAGLCNGCCRRLVVPHMCGCRRKLHGCGCGDSVTIDTEKIVVD